MHVANVRPNSQWEQIEDLVADSINEDASFSEGKTYELHNNGEDSVQVIVQTHPPETGEIGRVLRAGEKYSYKYTSTDMCFLKLRTKTAAGADIHIEELS